MSNKDPHHHCPFCVLKAEYACRGYWLYLPLFVDTAAGLGGGSVQPFARIPSLHSVVPALGRSLTSVAASLFVLVAAVASAMILDSQTILVAH